MLCSPPAQKKGGLNVCASNSPSCSALFRNLTLGLRTPTDGCSDHGSELTRCRFCTKTKPLPKGLMKCFKRAFAFCFPDTVPFSQALNLHQFSWCSSSQDFNQTDGNPNPAPSTLCKGGITPGHRQPRLKRSPFFFHQKSGKRINHHREVSLIRTIYLRLLGDLEWNYLFFLGGLCLWIKMR